MTLELTNKLMDLQKRLLETNDAEGLMLWDAVRQEIKQDEEWEKIAIYFAGCEAATAEGYASRKSASKYERGRHASICKSLREMIQDGRFTKSFGYGPFEDVKKSTLMRLADAETKCAEANK